MLRKSAFTLIELLVVIAIIAILAAILFPVFAQAKLAAKKSSELSNSKQLDLASLIYSNDFDDEFVTTTVYDFSDNTTYWAYRVQPYVKNEGIFRSPLDDAPVGAYNSWSGPAISIAANSLAVVPAYPGFAGNANTATDGVIGLVVPGWAPWFVSGAISDTSVTQPASTIMFGPKYTRDDTFWSGMNWLGANAAYIWPTSIFLWDTRPTTGNYYQSVGGDIPDGTRDLVNATPNAIYPNGNRGAVSLPTDGPDMEAGTANFSFTDGHAKAMAPVATNPDPVNQPQNNMWYSQR